jgi:hypothetical protein
LRFSLAALDRSVTCRLRDEQICACTVSCTRTDGVFGGWMPSRPVNEVVPSSEHVGRVHPRLDVEGEWFPCQDRVRPLTRCFTVSPGVYEAGSAPMLSIVTVAIGWRPTAGG